MSKNQAFAILEPAASRIRDPQTGRSIWMAKLIQDASLIDEKLSVTLSFDTHSEEEQQRVVEALRTQLTNLGWQGALHLSVTQKKEESGKSAAPAPAPAPAPAQPPKDPVKGMSGPGMGAHGGPIKKLPIPGIQHIIAVASGKGGVGKSTIATNLAIALQRRGKKVGLLDADVYGPSLPTMMRVSGKPIANDQNQIIPKEAYNIKCMSMGFMVEDNEPIIWRGPMVMGVIKQFFQNVAWGELDVLIVDLPPGTGDAQLTMIQAVPISGAVIVTTPQKIAVLDAVRGVEMFKKLDVPLLGIVENMSFFEVGGVKAYPFGQGGGQNTATQYGTPLLAQVPLEEGIRLGGDMGLPSALSSDPIADPFLDIARQVDEMLFS
jgi:ATP-binding protein involved in chromosome partitioning